MKKIIFIFSFIFLILLQTQANQSVVVSAIVWNQNSAPIIISINPDSNPRILKTNRTQSYTLYFRDNEKDFVSYTITPKNWYTTPISGTIKSSDYDNNNWAYINFLYLAPATAYPDENVTVTINDGTSIVSKELNLYVY